MTLLDYRRRAGLTQKQVADALDVDQSCVSHWEAGRAAPCRKHREQLAKLYGAAAEDLCGAKP